MTIKGQQDDSLHAPAMPVRSRDEAEHYVASVCFKTGPPRLIGVELEHTVHHVHAPARPLHAATLRHALGPHAPKSLHPDSPQRPLPAGGTVTVEPGGQVEISSAPNISLSALRDAVNADLGTLTRLLAESGLTIGHDGLDRHRDPRILVNTPRYDAMRHAFEADGPHGLTMMGGTAGLQVCLDAGEAGDVTARWDALHAIGPVLVALFSTSAMADAACVRMRTWLDLDGSRTHPVPPHPDPAAAWARYAMRAPVLCERRPGDSWRVPHGISFADWIDGAMPRRPDYADLDYHLSTLFPPVRPRGYLEVRYLDTQPPDQWLAPVALLAALFAGNTTIDRIRDICQPVGRLWRNASAAGLADPRLRRAARAIADLGIDALAALKLSGGEAEAIVTGLERKLSVSKGMT